MSFEGYLAISGALGALSAMAMGVRADQALLLALALLILSGTIAPDRALHGMSNEGVMTVALLFVLAGGVKRSGALSSILRLVLGQHRGIRRSTARLVLPVAGVSAFLNNTPVVAMLLPELKQWAAKHRVAASRLLIPLSYASIVGGMCTLIGTSTNLLIDGLLQDYGFGHLGIFWISPLGVPAALIAIVTMVVLGPSLLPRDRAHNMEVANPMQFTAEFLVEDGPLEGVSLAEISVPGLHAFAPIQIKRDEVIIAAPRADEPLQAGDKLMFAGPSAEILAVKRLEGLIAPHEITRPGTIRGPEGSLFEVIVGPRCRHIGGTVGDGSFRREYGAAVIAVVRDGRKKATDQRGAWVLEAGDVLLVEADPQFAERHRFGGELFLLTDYRETATLKPWHRLLSLTAIVVMAATVALGLVSMFVAALAAACGFILLKIVTWQEAARDIEVRVLLSIVAALGIGTALDDSGAAGVLADLLVSAGGDSPHLSLALVYLATTLCTELVTNNAAAVLMLPIALGTASTLGVSPMPFIASVMIAASASFVTPIGYQTNLMVYGAGGYRFGDFARLGMPVAIAVAAVSIGLAPLIWPF